MKILVIHNSYAEYGGEDAVYRAESALLESFGHTVERMEFSNREGGSLWARLRMVLSMFYNRKSAKRLADRIREFKPDIIHVHNFFFAASPAIFDVAYRLNVPVVMTLHNYRLICPSATLSSNSEIYENAIGKLIPVDAILKGVYRDSSILTAFVSAMTAWHHLRGTWQKKVDRYIVLSSFGLEKFAMSGRLPMDKVVLKPNFVKDPLQDGEVRGRREKYYLFVGRLVREKGLEVLLNATQFYHFKVVIIGDGPMKAVVEDYARRNQHIEYLGFQPYEVIIEHMKKCRAVIFPSIWYECFPITILEAYSTGTPVIASRRGSMKEIILDRVTGLHFEADNHYDLAAKVAMMESAANHHWVNAMYESTRRLYLEHYTPQRTHEQLMEVYDSAIAEKQQVGEAVPTNRSRVASFQPGRRAAVFLLAGLALGLGFTYTNRFRGANGWTAALCRPRVLMSVGGTKVIDEIGKTYTAINPAEASAEVLIGKLFNKTNDPRTEIKAGVIPYWMDKKSRNDFENGKTIVVNGWVLSLTEARQCALYHIHDSRI